MLDYVYVGQRNRQKGLHISEWSSLLTSAPLLISDPILSCNAGDTAGFCWLPCFRPGMDGAWIWAWIVSPGNIDEPLPCLPEQVV